MKKALMIITVAILIFISTGCFIQEKIELKKQAEAEELAFIKTKEEIIKFDGEYWKVSEEYEAKQDEYYKDLEKIPDSNLSKNDWVSIKNIEEKNHKWYSDYIEKFKSLNIPKPLDEFYYKKMEQFNNFINASRVYIDRCNIIITNWDNWSVTLDDRINELDNKIESYADKGTEQRLEAQKLQREIYREYGLDDLITKWQD